MERTNNRLTRDWNATRGNNPSKPNKNFSEQIAEIVANIPDPVFVSRRQIEDLSIKLGEAELTENDFSEHKKTRNILKRDTLSAIFHPEQRAAEPFALVDRMLWEELYNKVGIAPENCGPYYEPSGSLSVQSFTL